MSKILALTGILSITNAFEIFKVEKDVFKSGLHRDLVTNTTFQIDSHEEYENCSFIFVETVRKDSYIYYEEVKKLKEFEFFPHTPMNIEAPASVSEDMQFLWRLPFKQALSTVTNDFVFDIHVVEDHPDSAKTGHPLKHRVWNVKDPEVLQESFPIQIDAAVKFEYHMRYQPTNAETDYVDITLGRDTEVLFDCKDSHLVYHSTSWKERYAAGKANKMMPDHEIEDLKNVLTEDW